MSEKVLSADEVAAMRESIAVQVGPADAPYFPGDEHLHVLREVLASHEALRAERDQYKGGMECADEQAGKWQALTKELAETLDAVPKLSKACDHVLAKAREAGVIQ